VQRSFVSRLALDTPGRSQPLHRETWLVHVHPQAVEDIRGGRNAHVYGGEAIDGQQRGGLDLDRVDANPALDGIWANARATLVLAADKANKTLRDWLGQKAVDAWVRQGGRLVVLPDGVADDSASSINFMPRSADHAFPRDASGPLLRGLVADHFRDWGPNGIVAEKVLQRPSTGPACCPLDVGDVADGLANAALLILPLGRGHVILSGMNLLARSADTPAAAVLFKRLLHEDLPACPAHPITVIDDGRGADRHLRDDLGAITGHAATLRMCHGGSERVLALAGTQPDAINRLLADGGTLLVQNINPQTAEAWSNRLGFRIEVRHDTCFNVAKAEPHPWFAGLNNFDLCWVNRDEKQPIVRHTLRVDAPGCRTLVATVATRWEDYQGAAEQHKVALMYRRLEAFDGPRAAVIEIPRGPGRVLISQLLLDEAKGAFRDRAHRILSRWLDVLGVARREEKSPLTPRSGGVMRSDGFITDWLVLGPFTTNAGHPLDHAFVDEAATQPAEGRVEGGRIWQRVSSPFPQIDLGAAFGVLPPEDRVAYAAVFVYAPQDRSVLLDAPDMITLLAGNDGGTKILLNDHVLGRFDFVRELVLDSDRVKNVPLRSGWNTLVIKLHNPSGPWRFAARFLTAAREPVGDLRCSMRPED
jgi:hypothetical protein